MKRMTVGCTLVATLVVGLSGVGTTSQTVTARRPNIVFAIADDWSFPHASIYGDPTVSTPVFDRIAREGVRFTHAFAAAPSCTPSRAAILTGQAVHRLEEGGNLHGFLPKRFAVYPDLLEQAGYAVGFAGKGWGPGQFEPAGRARNPAGPQFKNFDDFIQRRPADRPFCFWFGSTDPHRPYEAGTGAQAGLKAESVRVPAFLPDTPEVRSDLLDYYFEVQRFDRDLGRIISTLERLGELENTVIIVTADNGLPFPRAKATVYDGGARVPLAIRWRGTAREGAVVDDFVTLADVAPTILDAAGLKPVAAMTGRSLAGLVRGQSQPGRDRVFVERERHANVRRGDLSYPARAMRTKDYLYIRNFRPDRWPAGDPQMYIAVGPYGDIDGSPSKSLLVDRQNDPAIARYFQLATAKRPVEELYDLRSDPHQLENVAGRAAHSEAQSKLRQQLEQWLRETGDPRVSADDDRWDRFPYYGQPGPGAPATQGLPAEASAKAGQKPAPTTPKPPPASPASKLPGGGRRSVDDADVTTGDADAGKRYFNGAGGCAACHAISGTFATVGSRYKGLALLQRMLYPGSGRDAGPAPAPPAATITTKTGQTVKGTVTHRDEFTISIVDAVGWTRSWPVDTVTITIDDPLRAHREQLPRYTDKDMHDVLAYLQSLR